MNLKLMNLQRFLVPIGVLVLIGLAWRAYQWPGLVAAIGALLMWMLLHFTRLMTIMKRAANRPIGFVDSAVMLNAKLKPGVSLMHVIAMTKALGERCSPEGEQPEVYRWRDAGGSVVTADFAAGKLQRWQLVRPEQA